MNDDTNDLNIADDEGTGINQGGGQTNQGGTGRTSKGGQSRIGQDQNSEDEGNMGEDR